MDEQQPLGFGDWARKYRAMAGQGIPDTPEGNRQLFKMREDHGQYVAGFAPQKPPQFMSLTNAEGRVIDVLLKADGTPQVVEPKVQNTQQGIMTMVNPTNAVPMVNPQTGQPLMGYAADPTMGGAPMPGIGGAGMAVTNAPTAAPTQTPAPSPTPYPEGATIRGKSDGLLYKVVNGVPQLIPGQ